MFLVQDKVMFLDVYMLWTLNFFRGLQDHLALLLPNSHSILVDPQPYRQWQHLSLQVRTDLMRVDGLLPVETCNWYYKRELCHQYKVIPDL